MKIRSITSFLNPEYPLNQKKLAEAGLFNQQSKEAYIEAGYEVQTTRMATIPFPWLFKGLEGKDLIAAVQELGQAAAEQGFAYTAIGPALIDAPESYELVPEIIAQTENIFACAEIANPSLGVSLPAVRAAAEIIHALAPQDPNGFANLYFTAAANVPPGSPFFPASYHLGDQPKFAIAAESANLAVDAFTGAKDLHDAVARLIAALEKHGQALTKTGKELEEKTGVVFNGVDFSLAPFPTEALSLGTAVERLGVPAVGMHGSLAASAIIADAIDKADFQRTGFSGLMLPVLEDSTLAKRGEEGHLTVKDMLMYSAVCGTGLDTIALPGDTTAEQIAPLLLDMAALSMRLNKPLTARLMPIPGKKAGEMTTFEFDFFANSRVLPLTSEGLTGFFAGDERFEVGVRKR